MVNKFFGFFLKKKMDRELKRFSTVETAFRSIKATTVSTSLPPIINTFFKFKTILIIREFQSLLTSSENT